MKAAAADSRTYTLRDIASLLGLSRSVIGGLIDAGFVTPSRGPRREYRFSFQDIVLLRAAQGLQAAQIPPRRIVSSLRRLRATLPEQMPLAGLCIAAVGNEVVVREGGGRWQAGSGQLLFDFDMAAARQSGEVLSLRSMRPSSAPRQARQAPDEAEEAAEAEAADEAVDWFQRGADLEATDAKGAEAAYRRAIASTPKRADAYLNLGVLLGETGRHAEAAAVYRQGIARCAPEALLHFNLAVALEDARHSDAALQAYEQCLAIDATMADAHFNAARLHDQLGRAKQAIRHYSAYRRLRRHEP